MKLQYWSYLTWLNYYDDMDTEDKTLDYFYAKDKYMFDLMDDKGFYLDKNGEGSFLLMLGDGHVTIVLSEFIEESAFCKQIYDMIVDVI